MDTQFIRKFDIIVMFIIIVICIWCIWLVIERPQPYKPRKEPIDTFVMGEEAPVKIITLNSYMTADENHEVAYILGDKGNLYALCYDMGKYYVTLWHPEFWEEIEVVDICAERPYLYAAALDSEGNVYVWQKEYLLGEAENGTDKRENWEIQQLENIPKVTEIYAIYDRFAIVTETKSICMWSPKENINPAMDDMELIDMETPILNIAASEDEVFVLDKNHDLWSIENGTRSFLKENVKSITQGYKGIAIQPADNENEVYIYNIDLFQSYYEEITFAGKYEAVKIALEDKISSVSLNGSVAVACTDKQEFYRWGWREPTHYANVAVPAVTVYDEPVKIDLGDVKYYKVIGRNIVYIDERNEMFIWI